MSWVAGGTIHPLIGPWFKTYHCIALHMQYAYCHYPLHYLGMELYALQEYMFEMTEGE